jgi:hypothetical protein
MIYKASTTETICRVVIKSEWVKPGNHGTQSQLHTWYLSMSSRQFSLKKLQASSLPLLEVATETMTNTVSCDRTSSCNAKIYSLRHCSEHMYLQHSWFIYAIFWSIHCSQHLLFKWVIHFHLTKFATFVTFYFLIYWDHENKLVPRLHYIYRFSAPLNMQQFLKCLSVCMCPLLEHEWLDGFYAYSVFTSSSITGWCWVNTNILVPKQGPSNGLQKTKL